MDYQALIEARRSSRAFREDKLPEKVLEEVRDYYMNGAKRLIPGLETKLLITGSETGEALEKAAGYKDFLTGAPSYLILLSDADERAGINAGYIMEDMILKLTDMDLATCWITFDDSGAVKKALSIDSEKDVAAIAAFGYGVRKRKKIRINIHTMSNIGIEAQRAYYAPKKNIGDLVFMDTWGNKEGVEDYIGFFDDMLWDAFHAVSCSPSYMNRQPYGFIIKEGRVVLVSAADEYTGKIDRDLDLGIAMLHFAYAAPGHYGKQPWTFTAGAEGLKLPEGFAPVASYGL